MMTPAQIAAQANNQTWHDLGPLAAVLFIAAVVLAAVGLYYWLWGAGK